MTSRIAQLMQLCMQEKATAAEREELLGLLQLAGNEGEVKGLIREALEGVEGDGGPVGEAENQMERETLDMNEEVSTAVLESIFQADVQRGKEARQRKRTVLFFKRTAYAAATFLAVVGGIVFFSQKKTAAPVVAITKPIASEDLPPGSKKAILTLANGSRIQLDDVRKGNIAQDGNVQIEKAGSGGTLVYHALPGQPTAMAYNTIATPAGGQYQLDLADGSKVWLNASSSLRYPTAFSGRERSVELTGEGYFEIAKNTAAPFFITVNGVKVQVLGTRLNINAYADEPAIRTTLISGAVKVATSRQELLLKPGEQAIATRQQTGHDVAAPDGLRLDPASDLEEVMAWKNGIFNFKNLDIETIMRQISRWYDVEVVYEGKKPEGHFSGMITRNTPARTVLKILECEGIHFTIASKKIVIGNQ